MKIRFSKKQLIAVREVVAAAVDRIADDGSPEQQALLKAYGRICKKASKKEDGKAVAS